MSTNAAALPRRHRITVDEYHRMGEAGIFSEDHRVELIEGEIIDMAPIGSRHAEAVSRLARLFIRETALVVRVQDPICLPGESEPQPDLAVVANRSYADAHPGPDDVLLLIEVADASIDYDRRVKIPLYARHGIPEVWLVDLGEGAFEVFLEPAETGYREVRRYNPGETVQPIFVPDVAVDPGTVVAP
ncbi:MAG TPA: Uma2 family endonuclease [Methylococcus sp.]|nr:Uma2 family endonuclease [Methylococcus sp.]